MTFLRVLLLLALVSLVQAKQGSLHWRHRLVAREDDANAFTLVLNETDTVEPSDTEIAKLGAEATIAKVSSFVELEATTTKVSSFVELETTVKKWPPSGGVDLNQVRLDFATEAVRRKADSFLPCNVANHAGAACTGAFVYTTDDAHLHRITKATGKAVDSPPSDIWSTNTFGMKNLVLQINERSGTVKLPTSGNENLRLSVGHVIAASLGGSNNAPINFFPHRKNSNSGGNYHAQEELVLYTLMLGGECGDNKIDLEVNFDYTNDNDLVPSGGTYKVHFNKECVDAILVAQDTLAKKRNRTGKQSQQLKYFTLIKDGMEKAKLADTAIVYSAPWTN